MRLKSDIQNAVEQVSDFLIQNGVDHESALRYTLFLEEALLVYRDNGFDSFTIQCTKHKKTALIKLIVDGEELNPQENNVIITNALEGMENPPVYAYHAGKNIFSYEPIMIIPNIRILAFVWEYMRRERLRFFLGVIINIFGIVADIVLPIVSALVVAAITTSVIRRLVYMGLLLVVLRLVRDVLTYAYQRLYADVYKEVTDSFSAVLAEKMLNIRIDSIRRFGSGIFIQRLTDDLTGLTDRFHAFMDMTSVMIQSIGMLIGMALISPPLFVFQLCAMIILLGIELKRTDVLQKNERYSRVQNEAYTNSINEIVRVNREIKLYCGKETFLQTVRARNNAVTSADLKKRVSSYRYNLLRWNLRDIFAFIYLLIEIYFISIGRLDVTMAVVLFNYCECLLPTISDFAWVAELTKLFLLSCERLYQLMVSPDFPVENFGETHIGRLSGDICFRDVTFAYPIGKGNQKGPKVLKQMNFHISPGEYVAITGRSGAGKTTVFNLITKLYETPLGEVSLDGINIRHLDEKSIRDNISIVVQNSHIFNMSVRDNLRIAKPDLTEEEMIEACKAACLHDDIMRMENGYDTLITDEPSDVSGGQQQRLAIAMCILKNAPILLMDEATSALDNITQSAIQQNIFDFSGKRTILVIAHRMSTIVNCDRILFMDDGQIVASGTHEELLKTCEGYRLLYESAGKPKNDLVDETE